MSNSRCHRDKRRKKRLRLRQARWDRPRVIYIRRDHLVWTQADDAVLKDYLDYMRATLASCPPIGVQEFTVEVQQ